MRKPLPSGMCRHGADPTTQSTSSMRPHPVHNHVVVVVAHAQFEGSGVAGGFDTAGESRVGEIAERVVHRLLARSGRREPTIRSKTSSAVACGGRGGLRGRRCVSPVTRRPAPRMRASEEASGRLSSIRPAYLFLSESKMTRRETDGTSNLVHPSERMPSPAVSVGVPASYSVRSPVSPTARRTTTHDQHVEEEDPEGQSADRDLDLPRPLARGHEPSTRPDRARANTRPTATVASDRPAAASASARVRRPGRPTPRRSAGPPSRDEDRRELEQTVREDELEEQVAAVEREHDRRRRPPPTAFCMITMSGQMPVTRTARTAPRSRRCSSRPTRRRSRFGFSR